MPMLTPELKRAVEQAGDVPVTLDEYEKLVGADYDDSPWTDEERDALSEEARRSLDGDPARP